MKAIRLQSCPKKYQADLDKAVDPEQTVIVALKKIAESGLDIHAETRRVDNGRLGIPVFLSVCGKDARAILPGRKQMGKGSSSAQAKASALMELVERFGFFSFWKKGEGFVRASWKEAERKFGSALIPLKEILASVNDPLPEMAAAEIMDACQWLFYPATRLSDGETIWIPLDWFRMLGEFNGSSAGNTNEESLLQGLAELVERHVSARVDAERPVLPTIQTSGVTDPVLARLVESFAREGIVLVLKDISLGMPMPTVAALAWDPATFPASSEIIFTAGTASTPEKAAIRAITEVAQLAGDFNTSSCYEASGLPKFTSLEQCRWLLEGPETTLAQLPDIGAEDILAELETVVSLLDPISVYAVETTAIGLPSHWTIAPGLQFRERDSNQNLGLFVGRKLAEEAAFDEAENGLRLLGGYYPGAHFLPFFEGLLKLRQEQPGQAAKLFAKAYRRQPDRDSAALVSFYTGFALTRQQSWQEAIPWLREATRLSSQFKEAYNLLGVASFKLENFHNAERYFDQALKIDRGSAVDLANRGICRKFLGRNAEAREDLQTALELDPGLDFARPYLDALANG